MQKSKKNFVELISWLIGIGGVFANIFAAIRTKEENFLDIFIILLVFETILTVIAIWHICIRYSYKSELNTLNIELENKNNEIRTLENRIDKEKSEESGKYSKAITTIISSIKNASKLNNDFCNRIPEITTKSYKTLEMFQKGATNEILQHHDLSQACEDYAISLYDLFNRYTSNLLMYILTMISAYLRIDDCTNKISVCVKLFDKPLNSNDEHGKVKVYTAFRDKYTYDKHEREIGEEIYTIAGNVDFGCCLKKDQYIINNTTKENESYLNEHIDFDKYYNCAVVVPIRIKQVDSSYNFFGYICCDCLNEDMKEIFKKETAQLLFSMAQLYATFLETLNSNWSERTYQIDDSPNSFLEIVYKKTYKGKTRER